MKSSFSRRQFLKTGSLSAAAVTMASGVVKAVHAGENNTIKVAWIGCGNRGAGAIRQALNADDNIQLYAAADAFEAYSAVSEIDPGALLAYLPQGML